MLNIFNKVIVVCCMLLSFLCCAQNRNFTSLSPVEFEKLLKDNPDVQLVDVRRPEEFDTGHMDKVFLINVQDSTFISKALILLDKSKPVAVYCRSGKRSKDAARKLSQKGFVVYDLDTGYLGWKEFINTK